MTGFLDITLGCMFSGKTTRLINKYHELKENRSVLCVNHGLDKRYNDGSMLSSHDKQEVPCILIDDLHEQWFYRESEYYNALHKNNYILINEAQFFGKLKVVVLDMLKNGKQVYLYGLDGDFRQQKFGEMLDLIPYCDNVEKLYAICSKCNGKAIFSHRLEKNGDQILIGVNNYIPLCRKCFP